MLQSMASFYFFGHLHNGAYKVYCCPGFADGWLDLLVSNRTGYCFLMIVCSTL